MAARYFDPYSAIKPYIWRAGCSFGKYNCIALIGSHNGETKVFLVCNATEQVIPIEDRYDSPEKTFKMLCNAMQYDRNFTVSDWIEQERVSPQDWGEF